MFDWREALAIVKPETLIGWHRKGFKLFWRWKYRTGRPRISREIRKLIARLSPGRILQSHPHVAAELSLKLGISLPADRPGLLAS